MAYLTPKEFESLPIGAVLYGGCTRKPKYRKVGFTSVSVDGFGEENYDVYLYDRDLTLRDNKSRNSELLEELWV